MLAKSILLNKNGMAAIELIPMLIITALFFSFVLGFFGAIHSGLLNSMGARNYAFETFNNRSNVVYFKEADANVPYNKVGARVHTSRSEKSTDDLWQPSARRINFGSTIGDVGDEGSEQTHNEGALAVQNRARYTDEGVSEIWIKQLYGICLWSTCEPK